MRPFCLGSRRYSAGDLAVPSAAGSVIQLRSVSRVYAGPDQVQALRDVNLEIHKGEYVAVVGRSGSGKSTLMNILGLLDRPSAGSYRLFGRDVAEESETRRAQLRAMHIGFVFQSFHLVPTRSALENVSLGLMYAGVAAGDREQASHAALALVGLEHRAAFGPGLLSGGERQRVAIARAIAGSPDVLLADEPTGNLDSQTGESIMEIFDSLHQSGHTIIMITHDESLAVRTARTLKLADGLMSESRA